MNAPRKTYGSIAEFDAAPKEERMQAYNDMLDGAIEDQRRVMREGRAILAKRKKAAEAKAQQSSSSINKTRSESVRQHSSVGLG